MLVIMGMKLLNIDNLFTEIIMKMIFNQLKAMQSGLC